MTEARGFGKLPEERLFLNCKPQFQIRYKNKKAFYVRFLALRYICMACRAPSTQCYKRLFLIPGQLNNSCIKDFKNCHQGISISFWLQLIDGLFIVAITNANKTILSMQVKDYKNLLIQLTAGSSRWQIKRSCFPVGWFFLTITWDHTSK